MQFGNVSLKHYLTAVPTSQDQGSFLNRCSNVDHDMEWEIEYFKPASQSTPVHFCGPSSFPVVL